MSVLSREVVEIVQPQDIRSLLNLKTKEQQGSRTVGVQ